MKKEEKEEKEVHKLSPKDYREILTNVQLELIRLESCSSKIKREKFGGEMKNILKDKITYELTNENEVFFAHQYDLIFTQTNQKDFALKISCTYSAKFSSTVPFSEEFLDIFSNINIHLNTWPYFREFVQNITQRMSIPPLTLPLMKRN